MSTVNFETTTIHIPAYVVDLASFVRWAESDEFPEDARICYLRDGVWADVAMEQIFSHLDVKNAVNLTLGGLVRQSRLGRYIPDGLRLVSESANLSTVPDGTFISFDALRSARAVLSPGRDGGFTSLRGSPDLVVEVVSAGSVDKDTEWLMSAYWDAGIAEYWLIDARGPDLRFDIRRYGANGYLRTRKQAGWIKSAVLGRAFRLTIETDELGNPEYTLAVR